MPDSPRPVHPARRCWILAAAAAAACPALALAQEADKLYALQPQLAQYVRPALHLLKARRDGEAEALLAQANALLEQDPDTRWPYRYYVLPPYALAVLRQGRAAEAVAMLEQALQARDRIIAEQLPRFRELVPAIDDKMGLELSRVEYGRELAAMLRTETVIRTGEDFAMNVAAEMTDLWILLAAAQQAAGQAGPLLARYTQRVAVMPVEQTSLPQLVAYEYRLYAFGQALAHVGALAAASDAWRRALAANTRRLQLVMHQGAPHCVYAACTMRRLLLSSVLLAGQGEQGLLDILETKSLGNRYREMALAAICAQSPPTAALLQTLEDEIAGLPATVSDVQGFLRLLAQHDLISGSAMQVAPPGQEKLLGADPARLSALRAQLTKSAAIGFMLLTDGPGLKGKAGKRYYLRYCISAQDIQLRLLGEQDVIERLVHTCRTDFLRGASQSAAAAALALTLLAGLPPSVREAEEWVLDPDGALHLLPFDALPDDDGKPLLCRHTVRVLTSLWQLLDRPRTPTATNPAVLIADPDYHLGQHAASLAASLRWTSATIALGPVAPLPETRMEARQAAKALAQLGISSEVLLGKQATAQALHKVRQPAVLHIASHAVLRSVLDQGSAAGSDAEGAMDLLLPGRQAGLVLSRGGQPDVMLAKDVARLRLQGTALVVLSACNTANGDIAAGEGIASLRRATELAGAHSTVAAVWQVPSAATSTLMAAFYAQLAKGASCAAALRAAKLEALANGAPPRAWAGFQLSGADRPLMRHPRRIIFHS